MAHGKWFYFDFLMYSLRQIYEKGEPGPPGQLGASFRGHVSQGSSSYDHYAKLLWCRQLSWENL